MVVKFKSKSVGKYAQHLGHAQSVGTTTIQKTVSKQVVHEGQSQEVLHPALAGDCRISVTGGRTIATAPYENVRISVSLDMPCTKEGLEGTYEFVTEWVGAKLTEATKVVKS